MLVVMIGYEKPVLANNILLGHQCWVSATPDGSSRPIKAPRPQNDCFKLTKPSEALFQHSPEISQGLGSVQQASATAASSRRVGRAAEARVTGQVVVELLLH